MAATSSIEWTEKTWNPTTGCTKISPGCTNCYIERTPPMRMAGKKFVGGRIPIELHVDRLAAPLHWKKPARVFVNSMSDLFHDDVPNELIDQVFGVMALCPQHTFQVLTKRAERMAAYASDRFLAQRIHEAIKHRMGYDNPDRPAFNRSDLPLSNVWLGFSAEDQKRFDERAQHLAQLMRDGWVIWTSAEPLLGPIIMSGWDGTFQRHWLGSSGVRWVVAGGESGPGARPCNIAWIRSIVQQCKTAGAACFVKQLGPTITIRNDSFSEWPNEGDDLQTVPPDYVPRFQGEEVRVTTGDRKGGEPSEWPVDLRVREYPETVEGCS